MEIVDLEEGFTFTETFCNDLIRPYADRQQSKISLIFHVHPDIFPLCARWDANRYRSGPKDELGRFTNMYLSDFGLEVQFKINRDFPVTRIAIEMKE